MSLFTLLMSACFLSTRFNKFAGEGGVMQRMSVGGRRAG